MKYKYIIYISIIILLFACGSSKPKYATEEELQQYSGTYYIIFTYFPKNSHLMKMGGIGIAFDVDLLRKKKLDDFVESFYEQLIYTPFLFSTGYWSNLECLGLNKELNMESWFNNFDEKYSISNIIEENKLKLQDGNYINIEIYKISENLTVKYVQDFKSCIMSSSIEFDINKIKSINKVAILLDDE